MRKSYLAMLFVAVCLQPALAAVPHQMPVQGRLTTGEGTPVEPGNYSFTFRIMNDSAAGIEVWPGSGGEVQSVSVNAEGVWQAHLGAVEPLPDTIFHDSLLWLEITVDDGTTTETLSRIRLSTGAYAFESVFALRSGDAASLEGLVATDFAPTLHAHSPAQITPQGSGSGLDADLLDGMQATDFSQTSHTHVPAEVSPQGTGSFLDADLLDGRDATEFADTMHSHVGLWSPNGPNYFFNGGRVGIGTTSPENMLHVLSGAAVGVIPSSASVGILEADNHAYLSLVTPDFAERGILFAEPSSNMAGGIIYNNVLTPDGLQFRTAFNVRGMALESSGRLSIGTFTGAGALQVSGLAVNSTVALPTNTIGPDEILGEAGLATNFNGATLTLASTTMQEIVTVQLDLPLSGYVLLTAKCNGLTHGTTGRNQGTVQIVETTSGGPVSPYSTTFGLVGHASNTLANSFPVFTQRVFFKPAGSFTFLLEAAQNAGNAADAVTRVSQSILTAVFYPTSYGDAMTAASATEAGDFSLAERLTPEEGDGYRVDLRSLELRAARLRLEAQEAELEVERLKSAHAQESVQAP